MSGTYFTANQPDIDATAAAVRQGLAEAYSAYAVTAVETRESLFMSHGPAVVAHHVGEPGRMGDADVGLDASDG
jgi:hypothetical protein